MKKGFTLIEAIVAIVLVVILALVSGIFIREVFHASVSLRGQRSIALSNRTAMSRVVRELKRCKKNTNILTFTAKQISFLDINNNTVTFSQSGSNLLRGSAILLQNLQNPCGLTFTYLDKNGNQTATKANIRIVRCRLTVVKDENRFVTESAARIRVRRVN
jgi:prepilin-type N-terminal cleavage/methylation domain-containing protein